MVTCPLSCGCVVGHCRVPPLPWWDIVWCHLSCGSVAGHRTVSPLPWPCGGIRHSNLMVGCLWKSTSRGHVMRHPWCHQSCGGTMHGATYPLAPQWSTARCSLNPGPAARCCAMPSPLNEGQGRARAPPACPLLPISKPHAPCRPSSLLSSPSWLSWALPPASSSQGWV